jgi:DNA-binding phage protein
VDRRRIELQLRLVTAVLHAEARRGHQESMEAVAERSALILDRLAIEIDPQGDPELAELFAVVRAEIDGLAAKD